MNKAWRVLGVAALFCSMQPVFGTDVAKDLEALAVYDYGDSREPEKALEKAFQDGSVADQERVEAGLINILQHADTPTGARDVVLRLLARHGAARSIPAVQAQLADAKIGQLAVDALMVMPAPEAQEALLRALSGELDVNVRIAAMGALGRDRMTVAIPALAEAASEEGDVGRSAVIALGAIGSLDALNELEALPNRKDSVREWALLDASFAVMEEGEVKRAGNVFRNLLQMQKTDVAVKIAAMRGLGLAYGSEAVVDLVPMLQDPSLQVRVAAARELGLLSNAKDFPMSPEAFGILDPKLQAVWMRNFASSETALIHLQACLVVASGEGRMAVIEAMGNHGGADAVPVLLDQLVDPDSREVAMETLRRMQGDAVNAKLQEALKSASGSSKVALLEVLSARKEREIFSDALDATVEEDDAVRMAGFAAVGRLATAADLDAVMGLLPNAETDAERTIWSGVLRSAITNVTDPEPAAKLLAEALPSSPPKVRETILAGLAMLETPQAVSVIGAQLSSPDTEVRKEMIRILSSVKNVSAAQLLLGVAKTGGAPSERILALRGYLDYVKVQDDRRATSLADAYEAAWSLAERDLEKDAIRASVTTLKGPRAKLLLEKMKPAGEG